MDAIRRSYHHGDLRRALLEAGIALAREGGPEAVVLREKEETHVSLTLGAAADAAAVATETNAPASKDKAQRPASGE